MKTVKIDGHFAVSTGELCSTIGYSIPANALIDLNIVKPLAHTAVGIYWRERDIPLIAMGLAEALIRRASLIQIRLNAEREHGCQ